MSDDRRAVLESIAYGSDARVTPGDRLRALEALAELEVDDARGVVFDDLSPEQALAEAETLVSAMPGILVCARVAAGWDVHDAVEPPNEIAELEGIVLLQQQLIGMLECRLLATERALQRWTAQRMLAPAPGGLL